MACEGGVEAVGARLVGRQHIECWQAQEAVVAGAPPAGRCVCQLCVRRTVLLAVERMRVQALLALQRQRSSAWRQVP